MGYWGNDTWHVQELILVLLASTQLLFGQGDTKPNIIIFLSDDHGVEDARCLGNPDLKTPVLDHWAAEGMVFQRAYAPTSVCTPSRAALFTGLNPHKNGCDRNHGSIDPGIKTLPDYLKPLGYRVVLAGKKHISPEDQFDFEYMELDDVPDFLSSIRGTPFCLIVSLNAPHQPYFNHKGGYSGITPKSWLPETDQTLRYSAAYYDHVNILDHELGAYQYWIEKYGYADALQVYTSDHGPAFPFAKWSLYEHGIRIPLIVKWPGRISPGTTNASLVSLTDLTPSLVEIAGGQVPDSLDGHSMVRHFNHQEPVDRKYLYATYTNQGVNGANVFPIRAILSRDWKLIVNLQHENEFHIARMDEPDERAVIDSYDVLQSWLEHESSAVRQRARHHWQRPAIELYHLKNDPDELVNLSMDAEYESIQQSMMIELLNWMESQNDPLTHDLETHIQQLHKEKH